MTPLRIGRLRRAALAVVGVVAAAAIGTACGPPPADFTVNSTADTKDAKLNGTCATSAGTCTLRAAMEEANFTAGHQVIGFAITTGSGPHRIEPATQLPILTDTAGATIDGYRQSGSAVNTSTTASNAVIKIELKGKGPTGIDGLKLQSPDNVIKGLAIWDFRLQVHLFVSGADSNEIIGNFIGTDAAGLVGASARNTASQGIDIQSGASGNLIGKAGAANRNVISGNYGNGVGMYGVGTDGNLVQNNLIGLRPNGTAGLKNYNHGVDINVGAADNLVGGSASQRNVISGNGASGVEISHDPRTLRNDVVGNWIGTLASGTSAPSSARNAQYGVFLEGLASCGSSCPADAGQSTVSDNVIVNSFGGVAVQKGRHDDVIKYNRIGVLANGAFSTNTVNTLFGVRVEKGSHRTTVGPGNIITNNGSGVQIQATGSNPTSSTEVRTYSNTITENGIYANTGLGIDLAPLGAVTPSPGPNVNDGVKIPTNVAQTTAAVTLKTCSGCTVELFLADSAAGQNGEGQEFLKSAMADPAGNAVIPVDSQTRGEVVTATATDTIGNTSEFSVNVLVP